MLPEAGATELIFLAAVALIVVGPKDLPILMRKVGQWVAKMRGLAAEFRSSFDELARQSELDELRKEVEALRNSRDPLTSIHPTLDEVSAGLDPSGFRIAEDPFENPAPAPIDPHADPHREYPAVGPGFGLEPAAEVAETPKPKRAPRKKAVAAAEPEPEAKPAPKPRRAAAAKTAPTKTAAKPRAKRTAAAETEA
jgi:sec-independent protein translocase protein TatB